MMDNEKKLSEEISLNYESGDNLHITWKYGSVKVGSNDIGDLVFLSDVPFANKLLKAVMLLDESRYYKLDSSTKVMRELEL